MNNEKDTETCIGCEKEFPHEQISTSSGEPMCELCENEMAKEVYQSGVEKLDEYLEARGLKQDFNIFCCAKWSDITEEQFVDLDENADEDYERWNLLELKQKFEELYSGVEKLANAFEEGDIKQEHYDLITLLQDKYKKK